MFGFNFDKRFLYIIIAILALRRIMAYSTQEGALLGLLLTIPGLLIAISFHEFAHAYAADKLGDDTPRRQGRLTLNPMAHLDPVGCFLLLFAGFGWGKPVEIDGRYYRNPARDTMLVALAGPVSNFIQSLKFRKVLLQIEEDVLISKYIGNLLIFNDIHWVLYNLFSIAFLLYSKKAVD